jgi:hypothetical protein
MKLGPLSKEGLLKTKRYLISMRLLLPHSRLLPSVAQMSGLYIVGTHSVQEQHFYEQHDST